MRVIHVGSLNVKSSQRFSKYPDSWFPIVRVSDKGLRLFQVFLDYIALVEKFQNIAKVQLNVLLIVNK